MEASRRGPLAGHDDVLCPSFKSVPRRRPWPSIGVARIDWLPSRRRCNWTPAFAGEQHFWGRPALKTFARSLRCAVALLATTGLCLPGTVAHAQSAQKEWLVDLANPLMGTDSNYELSYGN